MGKIAIVLGATGVVGRALVNHLALNNQIEEVIALTRRPVDYNLDKVTNKVVDFEQLEEFANAFKGEQVASKMCHIALHQTAHNKQQYYRLDELFNLN
ncbi:NAD-dependent epimerase/dehydratase family protein [Shewanella woodyi]|uniref:NAD-dependent epimerase/dehydratase family protein n=1 Tax=Shewanella woodyi TaxID=60961 RepID=UPI0037478724